eukprot:3140995-Pleurochrysis_carterae.AAC.14
MARNWACAIQCRHGPDEHLAVLHAFHWRRRSPLATKTPGVIIRISGLCICVWPALAIDVRKKGQPGRAGIRRCRRADGAAATGARRRTRGARRGSRAPTVATRPCASARAVSEDRARSRAAELAGGSRR